jgi:carbon monoxide dehydrogenase subunit G
MPTFSSSDRRAVTIRAPRDRVAAALSQPDIVKLNLGDDLESGTRIDDRTLRIVRKPVEELGMRFHGDYTVRYENAGDAKVTWSTITTGNMRARGEAVLTVDGVATRLDYSETIECDMDVNRILGAMLRPIVERKIKAGIGAYVERVKARLEGA